jgi:hypothetical protein
MIPAACIVCLSAGAMLGFAVCAVCNAAADW